MSKKNKFNNSFTAQGQAGSLDHSAEYSIIKMDLIKVIALNALYLTAILALYYTDKNSPFLEQWFARILHF
jgi:hypothetical protein